MKFTSFRSRTIFYKSRKEVKDKENFGVSLDLTNTRLDLLKQARSYVDGKESVNNLFADINCVLQVSLKSGKLRRFSSMDELRALV